MNLFFVWKPPHPGPAKRHQAGLRKHSDFGERSKLLWSAGRAITLSDRKAFHHNRIVIAKKAGQHRH